MQLLWFRNDLRALDNRALQDALAEEKPVIALYIHATEQMDKHNVGANRQLFHLRHVEQLFNELNQHKIPCLYKEVAVFDDIPKLLTDLVEQLQIKQLWYNQEYGVWEQERDAQVQKALQTLPFPAY